MTSGGAPLDGAPLPLQIQRTRIKSGYVAQLIAFHTFHGISSGQHQSFSTGGLFLSFGDAGRRLGALVAR